MLKSLKELFKTDTDFKSPSEHDLKVAAATLMFELIRSDGRVDEVELTSMRDLLQREFNLNNDELDELSELAEERALEAISLQGFTREICEQWDNPKRLKLLEYLWTLALADERIDAHERHFVRKIAGLLYLNDTEIAVARENAKRLAGITAL